MLGYWCLHVLAVGLERSQVGAHPSHSDKSNLLSHASEYNKHGEHATVSRALIMLSARPRESIEPTVVARGRG